MENFHMDFKDFSGESNYVDEILVVYPSCSISDNANSLLRETALSTRSTRTPKEAIGAKQRKTSRKNNSSLKEINFSEEPNSSGIVKPCKKNSADKRNIKTARLKSPSKEIDAPRNELQPQPRNGIENSQNGKATTHHYPVCRKTCSSGKHLTDHVSGVHSDHTKLSCTQCDYTAASTSNLYRHTKRHEAAKTTTSNDGTSRRRYSKSFQCPGHTNESGPRHPNKSAKCNAPIHPCSECDKTFATHTRLLVHRNYQHINYRSFECEMCDYKCSSKPLLTRHNRTHTGEKPFPCDICNKSFALKKTLKFHMLQHSDVPKPYICEICSKAFTRPGKLQLHLRAVHEGKRYTCEYCSKQFMRNDHMKRHHALHTGVRPHICSKCGKGFIQAGGLKYHIQRCDGDGSLPSMINEIPNEEMDELIEGDGEDVITIEIGDTLVNTFITDGNT